MNSELKNKFIELRVKGESLKAISDMIGVPKTTLWRWEKEEKEHINEIQLDEQEEYEWEWRMQRKERIAELQNTIGDLHFHLIEKLGKNGHYLNTKDLILHLNLLRGELDHYRIKPLGGTGHRPVAADNLSASPELAVEPGASVEQNGTISFQNGTTHRSITPATLETSLSSAGERGIHELPSLGKRGKECTASAGRQAERVGTCESLEEINRVEHLDAPNPQESTHVEQNGTILSENGTPHSSTIFPTLSPPTMEERVGERKASEGDCPSTGVEQNGTISLQNGTPPRSTTPDNPSAFQNIGPSTMKHPPST